MACVRRGSGPPLKIHQHIMGAGELGEALLDLGQVLADQVADGPARGVPGIAPFSAVPTPHVVDIDGGPRVHAMCAIDALGIAAM